LGDESLISDMVLSQKDVLSDKDEEDDKALMIAGGAM
jgi:hypothetical protein